MYIDVESFIFWFFTAGYVIAAFIHLYMRTPGSSYYGWGGKKRGELGVWGIVITITYLVFLIIYGGIYWW